MKILVTSGDHLLQGSGPGTPYCTRPPGPELRYGLVKLYFELHIPKLVSEILEFVVIVSSRSRKC